MDIHKIFEAHYAEQNDCMPWEVEKLRLSNGSYAEARIATDFRYFRAGFEANSAKKTKRNTNKTGDNHEKQ